MHAATVCSAEECMKWAVHPSLHRWRRGTGERGGGRVLSRDKHENKKEANFSFAQTCTQASVCFVNHTIAHLKLQTSEPNSYVHGSNPVCKPGLVNSVYQKIKILMMVPSDLSPAVLCKCLHLQCNLSVITGESRNSSEGGSLKGI